MGLAFFSAGVNTSLQWRGPLGIQIVFPAATLLVIYWLPESPRWNLMKNNVEAARKIVMSLHGQDAGSQEFATAEFYQKSRQAEFDRTLDNSWKTCFTKPSSR